MPNSIWVDELGGPEDDFFPVLVGSSNREVANFFLGESQSAVYPKV